MFNLHAHCTDAAPTTIETCVHVDNAQSRPTVIPLYLARLIAEGSVKKSCVQVLFAWLALDSTQSRKSSAIRGPFPTTEIASRCGLSIKAAQRAKAGLVALGVFYERQRNGNASILTLKLDDASADQGLPKIEGDAATPTDSVDAIPNVGAPTPGEGGLARDRVPAATPSYEPPLRRPRNEPVGDQNSLPLDVQTGPAAKEPSPDQGGLPHDPASNDTLSRLNINARAASTSSSYAFTNSKKLAFTSSVDRLTRDQNARKPQRMDDLSHRSRRLYRLFLERGPAEALAQNGERIPNVGECLQIQRFLQQGVPDQLLESMILKHRSQARHFGLVRSMILKRLESAKGRRAASGSVGDGRRHAEREIAAALLEAAAGSDVGAAPTYEGLPNAAAYRPIDPSWIEKWRRMYADECR